jgi:hypothetical protein
MRKSSISIPAHSRSGSSFFLKKLMIIGLIGKKAKGRGPRSRLFADVQNVE